MDEEVWEGFAYELDGVRYFKHTCSNCGRKWTDSWVINTYCGARECRRRAAGL